MSAAQTVINARTGAVLLQGATPSQYDRWYDHHCFYRSPRSIEEVRPDLRASYQSADSDTHYLVEDEA